MSEPRLSDQRGLALGLIGLGVVARLLPHPPNVTPLTALALFGAASLPRAWGIMIPLASIIFSDVAFGMHDVIAFTWGSMALIGWLGWWLRGQPGVRRIALASVLGATVFFVVTNFGVWLLGDAGTMYPKTLDGLRQCYVAALPFYRNSLVGDSVYTLGIFGAYAWLARWRLGGALQETGGARRHTP